MTESDAPRCVACGNEMPGRTRRARWCSPNCKMRVRRGALAAVSVLPPDQKIDGPLVRSVLDALVEASRLETVDGQLALVMARRFESGEGTAAALATLSRELRNSLALALQGATSRGPDILDEFNRRRLAKIAQSTLEGPKL